jgi:biotin carboxyl carrier protein
MTDHDADLRQIEQAAQELIPELAERLARHGLGELEVRRGSLRVRVAGTLAAEPSAAQEGAPPVAVAAPPATPAPTGTPAAQAVTSPAVGFFVYADGLGPGLPVQKGDALGWVEMLGVRHDVRAPRGGTVRNLVTESGEPVEYAQLLIELEPAG